MGVFTGNRPDTSYEFVADKSTVKDLLKRYKGCNDKCALCTRSDYILIGPFAKYD